MLQIVHDASGHTTVSDLTLVDVNTPEAVEALLARAMEKRSVGCTAMNEESSRSHAVFTLRIEGTNASSQLKVTWWQIELVCRAMLCLLYVEHSLPILHVFPAARCNVTALS